MRRSKMNDALDVALAALKERSICLPPFAYWSLDDWAKQGDNAARIRANGLGWDVSDFGSGDFDAFGAVMFTLRNGNHKNPSEGTPYAEKVIILTPGQRLPLHFHWSKTEDIINRGGGVMVMELYNAHEDDSVDYESPVSVYCDAMERKVGPGELFELHPGESITLTPRLYHRFWASKDGGVLVCGEVSSINDDTVDNCFGEPVSRYTTVEDDAEPSVILCSEY